MVLVRVHLVQVQEIRPSMVRCILVQLDEEIEIKQLRKEQVPRAHPMPDFSKPFVPKRY
jgi:hypothetical protein